MKSLNYKRFVWLGVPFVFIVGSLLHFAYDLFPNVIVSLFVPINESIWEHTKLIFFPTVLWYWLYFLFTPSIDKLSKPKWFTACVASVVSGIVLIPLFFYFYTGAFGIESLWIDIFIFFISVLLAQLIAMHFYKHAKGLKPVWSFNILLLIFAIYILFTFFPPSLPIFTDFS